MLSHPHLPDYAWPGDDAVATTRRARRCVLSFLLTLAAGMIGVAGLNVIVDPYGAFGCTLLDVDSRTADSRTARAELLARYDGPTVLIGSSRTRVGYDGSLPIFSDGPACNIGLDGTHISELAQAVEQAAARPNVRRIVLSLDLHLFTTRWTPNADYRCSRFNPGRNGFEHTCDLLWNGRSIEASFRALRRLTRGTPRQHDDFGFARRAEIQFERATQPVRTRAALTQFFGPDGLLAAFTPCPTAEDELRRIASACRSRDIELTIVIDPVHVLLLEGLHASGGWDDYLLWKRKLTEFAAAERITLWDFTSYGPYTTEPLLQEPAVAESRWFWEPSHMRSDLGAVVLNRVFEAEGADPTFGTRLTPANLSANLATLNQGRDVWLASAGGERDLLAELLPPPVDRQRELQTAQPSRSGVQR